MDIKQLLNNQHELFLTGKTLSYAFRKQQLDLLEQSIHEHTHELLEAFKADLNKCEFDVVTTELSLALQEIKYFKKHLRKFMRPRHVHTTLLNFPARGRIICEPYGNVLIMSPWNYPFQLTINPLVASIAGGNTTIVKPSAYTPNVAQVIKNILDVFDPAYIATVMGGRAQNQELLDQKFDLIFFTGSKDVGKIVEEKASSNLCPVVLELGGKSPCIVDSTAKLKTAVRRIVWGKFLNAGQTCIAPDYILVHSSIYEQFIQMVIEQVKANYYTSDKLNDNFMYIVNDKHVERLKNLINLEKLVFGGKSEGRLFEPTILRDVEFGDAVMQEEIFGPIMPIIKYDELDEVIKYITSHDKPLALYFFSRDKQAINKMTSLTSSGGVCINEVIMHFTEHNLPFGGVGASGMGNYHGKHSFTTFTHSKCVLSKSPNIELMVKYPPYTDRKSRFAYFYLGHKQQKDD
ncbi:MAG: aldehyde dehydrogenase family protein [Clostridia bacterium]|nr:aldehyde dehydrogenase family protein [Clostridia bacterium]